MVCGRAGAGDDKIVRRTNDLFLTGDNCSREFFYRRKSSNYLCCLPFSRTRSDTDCLIMTKTWMLKCISNHPNQRSAKLKLINHDKGPKKLKTTIWEEFWEELDHEK